MKLYSRRHFTAIEMLCMFVAFTALLAMIIPSLSSAKYKAKFTRWFAYNAHWNRDADCVVNFNFQDGQGLTLRNGAEGCDWNNNKGGIYNSRDYDGILCGSGYTSSSNSFTWSTGGRWGKFKKALRFKKGSSGTCVQVGNAERANMNIVNDAILDKSTGNPAYVNTSTGKPASSCDPQRDALDFTPFDNFTIIAWIKFGDSNGSLSALESYECIFSRAHWGDTNAAAGSTSYSSAQYDLYTDIKSSSSGGTTKTGSFDIDSFTLCLGFDSDAVEFKNAEWKQVALRYSYPPPDVPKTASADTKLFRATDVFVNGKLQNGKRMTYNETANGGRTKGVLVLGGVRTFYSSNKNPADGTFNWPFEGLMDEFMVLKKYVPDAQIYGNYMMGIE